MPSSIYLRRMPIHGHGPAVGMGISYRKTCNFGIQEQYDHIRHCVVPSKRIKIQNATTRPDGFITGFSRPLTL